MGKQNVYFVNGQVRPDGIVGIIAYLSQLAEDEVEFSRFYMHNPTSGAWMQRELEHDLVAAAFLEAGGQKAWHLLSKRGRHLRLPLGSDPLPEIQLPGADTGPKLYGYLFDLRVIAGALYACGFCRQVLRFTGREWIRLDSDLLTDSANTAHCLTSIDGFSAQDLYAVGWLGEIFHYDGNGWRQLASPTNLNLRCVRCAGDEVFIAGDRGLLLQGRRDVWRVHQNPDLVQDFWGLEIFQDTPYLAHLGGLAVFDGASLQPHATNLEPEIDGYRLHANARTLWSFGQNSLAYTDGTTWRRVLHPDNVL